MSNQIERAWSALDAVAAAKGSNKKKAILEDACNDPRVETVLRGFFKYSNDPFIRFGVDIDPEVARDYVVYNPCVSLTEKEATEWWADWTILLDRLSRRDLTGNVAREAVYSALRAAPFLYSRWTVPMFRRSYTIGVGSETIDSLWPGLIIWFQCQLASTWDGVTIPAKAVVEPKYDGLRALFFLDPANPMCLSRNGKELFNVKHILDELMVLFPGFVVDGELFNTDWSASVSAARSDEKGDTSSRFKAFDIISISEFQRKVCEYSLKDRRIALRELEFKAKFSIWDPGIPVSTPQAVLEAARGFVDLGYEGGVLKDLDSKYDYCRSGAWMKVKEFQSADLTIVGFEKGRGKNKGRLGALLVEGEYEGTQIARSQVGSGFSDEDRVELWNNKEKYLGKIVETKFQGLTNDKCLRFPVFMRIREDR